MNKIIRFLLHRKTWLIAFSLTFALGMTWLLLGTFTSSENMPERVEFYTNAQYVNEINSFFNRTDATPKKDALNKLVENYWVRGYAVLPTAPKPAAGYPVIIWMHGFGVSAEIQMNFPRQFAKCGFLAIALSQPGHGDSGGFWDMGIQVLAGIYSAVDWLVNKSDYKDLIDPQRIGVSGHSMGGVATARAGIFDNWTNPKTGHKIGTAGQVRAYCSIYCWDDLNTMAENLMQQTLGIDDILNQPAIQRFLEQWRWLSNYDPTVVKEELRLRGVTPFIAANNTPNFCLITGGADELISMEAQYYIAANATKNSTGAAQADWMTIQTTIQGSENHAWSYGDVVDGTGRKLVIIPGVTHIGEAISDEVCRNTVEWFNDAMQCTSVDPTVPADPWTFPALFPTGFWRWDLAYLGKMGGWTLILLSAIGLLFPVFSYLSTSRLGTKPVTSDPAPERPTRISRKRMVLYLLIGVAAIALSALFSLPSLTHYWIFDLILPYMLLAGAFLLACMFVLTMHEKRRNNLPVTDLGFQPTLKSNLRSVVPLLASFAVCISLLDMLWFFQMPIALPRPLELGVWGDFLTFFGILFLVNFGAEWLFRGLVQPKLSSETSRTWGKWAVVVKSAVFSGITLGLGATLWIVIAIGPLFVNVPWLIGIILGGTIMAFFVAGCIDAWIYQKTKTVLGPALFNAILFAFLLGGKLLLPFA